MTSEPLPSAPALNAQTANPIYPKLPEISGDQPRAHGLPSSGPASGLFLLFSVIGFAGANVDKTRFERLRRLFSTGKSSGRASPPVDIDMDKLREDCWMGIPHKLRPQAWRLLSVCRFPEIWFYGPFNRGIYRRVPTDEKLQWKESGKNIGIMWSSTSTNDSMINIARHSDRFTLTSQECVH